MKPNWCLNKVGSYQSLLIEHVGYTEKQVCKVQSREPPAVAPGELEGAGKWELEGEREPESGRGLEREGERELLSGRSSRH